MAIVGGLLYLQSGGGERREDDGFGTVELPAAKNATGAGASARDGRAAPDFLLPSLDGEPLRLSDLQGTAGARQLLGHLVRAPAAPRCRT